VTAIFVCLGNQGRLLSGLSASISTVRIKTPEENLSQNVDKRGGEGRSIARLISAEIRQRGEGKDMGGEKASGIDPARCRRMWEDSSHAHLHV